MTRYRVVDPLGEEDDEFFDTREAAEEYISEQQSAEQQGAEILHWSNPGDYEYDEESFEATEYEIEEV